ncbi:hypothetical protein BGZ52_002129, partial [Haplosporangium bisporale]
MLQQPLDQGSRTSNSGAHPDAQGREGCDFASEEDKQAYGEEEDYEYYDEDDYYEDEDDDLDDVYGDFSVNTKSPPRAKPKLTAGNKPIRSLSNSISQNHQHQPDSTNIRPIPPEILHQIFSYVDHPTLYRGISRVSRQFNAIAKHHIELVGIWTLKTQKEEDDLLEKLRSGAVNVLKVQSSNGQAKTTGRLKPYDRWHWAWQRFVGFITDPIYNNRTLPDTSDLDHLDVTLSLTKDWSADPITCSFLAQLNSIAFVGKEACNEDMDSLLRHCRRLTCLSAPGISYTRPPQKTPPNVDKGVRAALAVAEQRRHTFSTPQERKDYHWRHQIPIARDHHQKLLQRVEKKLVREEIMSRRHQHLASSWRCPRLRVLELRIGTAKQEVSAEGYEDVFRFLGHAFPNLDQLTLHLDALWVGQEIQIEHTTRELRTMTFENNFKGQLSSYTRSWHKDVKTKVWQESPNALRMLGRLSRLERLIVYVNKVPGVLCPSHFAFLRGAGYRGREQDGVAEPQFCPRLQSIVISSSMTIAFGKTREELFRERQFVNALKTMRPE